MKRKIISAFSVFLICLAFTSCGSSEPASAPNVAESERTAVQEKLNKSENKADVTKEIAANDTANTDTSEEVYTENTSDETNILVAYFSRADENYSVGTVEVGNTQIVAEYIAEQVGADSFHIETVTPYPADYDECCDVAKQELADNARPEISGSVKNMDSYDIVFLGYPIWWGDMPMAVYTFMESYDFSDKVVIPFNTHEGSGESGTYSAISSALQNAQVLDGMAIQGKTAQEFNSDTQQAVRAWLDGLGF